MSEPKKTESEVIASFRNGDKWAMEYIYGLHSRTLCYFATDLTRNKEQAEEIVSDTFIKLFRIRQNFDTLTNIRAFLYITVRNSCFNAIRYNKRITRAQEELLYLMQHEADHQELDDIKTRLLEELYAEIEKLPPQCRQVFKHIYVDKMNTLEIARHMGLSRNTVQNHRTRAVKLLRTVFLKRKLLSAITLYGGLSRITPYLAGLAGWLGFS